MKLNKDNKIRHNVIYTKNSTVLRIVQVAQVKITHLKYITNDQLTSQQFLQ